MKTPRLLLHLPLYCAVLLGLGSPTRATADQKKTALVIHGGASSAARVARIQQNREAYRKDLQRSLRAGHAILQHGGSSLDAVEAAIIVMEDSPLFNAGKGAVFTLEGRNELDSSIMDGKTMKAGAVGGVTTVKNPIRAARAVMEKTWHVLLTGQGAEAFAKQAGLELVAPEYFRTEAAWREYRDGLDHAKKSAAAHVVPRGVRPVGFGTVGAVALDQSGDIAAGTSTGGLMYKKFGRIGDSPIIGAGTYADNATCGISATGQGEYFIRRAIAFDISARMKYRDLSLAEAARQAIQGTLTDDGGEGGVIGLDRQAHIIGEHNTPGMLWASIDTEGEITIHF